MSYSITLYNTPFDRANDNVILYDTRAELETYLNSLANVTMSDINFDAKNIINTSVTFEVPEQQNLLRLLNYNYCKVEGDGIDNTDVLFYWIDHSRQNDGINIQLELSIDPWNTYIYGMMSSQDVLQGMLQRAHTDRVVKINDKYYYNWESDSPLFEREEVQGASKKVTSKQKLIPQYDTSAPDSAFNQWFNTHISHWRYVYMSTKPFYVVGGSSDTRRAVITEMAYRGKYELATGLTTQSGSGLVVFAYPIYKDNSVLKVKGTDGTLDVTALSMATFLNLKESSGTSPASNGGYAYVKAIKNSIVPPFSIGDMTGKYSISQDGQTMTLETTATENCVNLQVNITDGSGAVNRWGLPFIDYQDLTKTMKLAPTSALIDNEFTVNQIKAGINEPKIYNEDYSQYHIYFGGQTYDMPISKSSKRPIFKYYEVLTPDITKFVLSYDSASSNEPYANQIFTNANSEDFTGLVGTIDLSMWYSTDSLDAYLAQNKNNLQIFQNQQAMARTKANTTEALGVIGGVIGMGASALSGNPTGVLASGAVALGSVANRMVQEKQLETEAINRELTIDNMRQSPASLSAVNSNAMLLTAIDEFGLFIELQEMIPFEREQVVDSFKRYGYTFNVIKDIREYFKTRKIYNYIQANVFDLNIPVSEDIKAVIKEMFAKGVRIWHGDTFTGINFNQINYERSID